MSLANQKKSILRRNPHRDRRSFIARMNPLSPIGDIASGGLTESTQTATLTWETANDWDSAVSEYGVVHESTTNTDYADGTTIAKGYPGASPILSSGLVAMYLTHEDSGSTAYDFSANGLNGSISGLTLNVTGLAGNSAYSSGGSSEVEINDPAFDFAGSDPFSVALWFNLDSTSGNQDLTGIHGASSGTGDKLLRIDDGTPRFYTFDGGGEYLDATSTASTGNWYLFVGTFDPNSNGKRVFWQGSLENSTTSQTSTQNHDDAYMRFPDTSFNGASADIGFCGWWNRELTTSEVTQLYDAILGTSTLTTATKSFGTAKTPNLQNLSYSLNSQSVVLDIIGSPGTASEEVVTQTLDGSSSYSLTWSNSHTDFRVKPKMSSTDATVTPTVGRVELAG